MSAFWFGYRIVEWDGSSAQAYQWEADFGRFSADEVSEEIKPRRAVLAWLRREAVSYRVSDMVAKLCHDESPPLMIIDPIDDSETIVIRAIKWGPTLMIGR